MTIEDTMNTRACARCGAPLKAPMRPRRPRQWCSQRCRRAAYEERRAAAAGAVAVRVVEVERAVEKPPAKPTVDEAIKIVLGSQRAWRAVLDELTRRAEEGAFDRWGGHECERNSLAAYRFTMAVVAYMQARVDEERDRQRRSWDERRSRWYGPGPGLAGRPRDRDDLG
jgi:endogenous inhibitor of DNA gyrase (YacG/DUF329 family)